jgi:hypothetical protein
MGREAMIDKLSRPSHDCIPASLDDVVQRVDSTWTMRVILVLRVQTVLPHSAILARSSLFVHEAIG